MDDVVVARHGESESASQRLVGGDSPLTERGRVEAAALGRELAPFAFDVCITSGARRARETAATALAGRDVPTQIDERFGDIAFGVFDGKPLEKYREWIGSHAPNEAPPGGESRVATLRRFCTGYRALLERPEPQVLVVAHGLALSALTDVRPRPIVTGVPYGSWIRLTRGDLADAVARIERWCEAPSW
jgi:broad specificity phosphatase PhoE